ncbi:GNAT family N-acetyltransferase [Orenia marismortui]|uniref:L-amino acid N-acyltransferase YncA n=1 Tax=Orenia marismortui TaxID=46469 RepID=A0A4R8GYX9_9FIRM|nr:GNAT family N-acetyltransferase [Orenia marismortui]TDX51629.1 L-amino acid N-acyltransferase YncA [Orenia marismortui]
MNKLIDTKLENLKLRFAKEEDTSTILNFIKDLAEYEKLSDQVVATEDILKESLFDREVAEVIIAEYEDEAVAFALFFHNFSTFLGKAGIYLEDLYVKPKFRGKGIGTIMLSYLANLAQERNCGRFEWSCLDWNEASINFYKEMGAVAMEDWTVYRVSGSALDELAQKYDR